MTIDIRPNAPCMCYDRHLSDEMVVTAAERIVLLTDRMWEPGDTITVSFFGGSSTQRSHCVDVARRLEEICNINFDFLTSGVGFCRIAFNPSLGAWSFLGKDILGVSKTQPTMNLGFDQAGTYTHEFVHMLGGIHEHQSPFGNPIQWNKPQVYHDLGGPPNNWDRGTIDHNMFNRYSVTQTNGTTFDPKSIMLYSFPASWTIDGFSVKPNEVLSDLDKQWLALKYPGRVQPPVPPTPPNPPSPPVPPAGVDLDFRLELANKMMRVRLPAGWQVTKFS